MEATPEISLMSESMRHLRSQSFSELGDIWRHEGLKKGVERVLDFGSDRWLGRLIMERLLDGIVDDPLLATTVGKLRLDGPTGLAPGWDKTGKTVLAWQFLGANHTTPGGIPFYPQVGNPMPRLRTFDHYVGDHGTSRSLNAYGFPSLGAKKVTHNIGDQLESGDVDIPVIPQVTLNKEFYEPENRHAIPAMVARTIKELLPVANAISLGLSSPNTFGMRDAQVYEFLRPIVMTAREAAGDLTVSYKADGDGGTDRLDMCMELAIEAEMVLELINSTARKDIKAKYGAGDMPGGLAGADPEYHQMALDAVRYVYEQAGDRIDIIGMGGINGPRPAMNMLRAGASAISVNTYVRQAGVRAISSIERGLSDMLRLLPAGQRSLDYVIGADTTRGPKVYQKSSGES